MRRKRWLGNSSALLMAGLFVAAAWTGCDAGGGSTVSSDDEQTSTGASGGGGSGGDVALPCGIDCSTIQVDECSEAICDTDTLQCAVVPLSDKECDDGLFCTIGDTCVDGVCTGAGANDCNLSPPSWTCQGVVCDEDTKSCSQVPLPEGTECIASDPCVIGASCDANNLCTGPVNDCFFAPVPDNCHVSVCNSNTGECEPTPGNNNIPCLDTLCSEGGSCSNGACVGATVKTCEFVSDQCNAGSCDATTGGCVKNPINEGLGCSDQVGCTVGDSCSAGSCTAGATVAACTHDDGCCGPSCTSATDNDCQSILLFGDDLAASSWQVYRDALTAAGRQWDESNFDFPSSNQGAFPDAATLANYDTVIIVAEAQTDWPDADNTALVDWLQAGGEKNAFFIGKDLIADWYNAGAGNAEADLYALLGVTYIGSSASTLLPTITGVDADPISSSFFADPIRLSMDTYSTGDYADETLGPATHIAFYTGYPAAAGFNHSAMARYDSGTYQVVWLGLNFHDGMVDAKQRNQLMIDVMEWFKP